VGQVLIDGRDARERSQLWLHSSIGYVLQTPHLFSGTVRENLRMGKPDATEEQIWQAIRAVSADEVIAHLEHGLDTDVGEGGDPGDALAMQKAAESVARLMTAIRIVFTDATGKIIGQAKLDITLDDPTTTEQNEANWATKQKDGNTVIEAPIRLYEATYTQDANGGTLVEYGEAKPTAVDNDGAQTLMPLVQNTATMLSTYVYLDGDMVDNSMVANGASSMTGTLNLQFSSSAALDPMDYTPLKDQGGSSTPAPSSSEEANG
jgi:hypothetical protein